MSEYPYQSSSSMCHKAKYGGTGNSRRYYNANQRQFNSRSSPTNRYSNGLRIKEGGNYSPNDSDYSKLTTDVTNLEDASHSMEIKRTGGGRTLTKRRKKPKRKVVKKKPKRKVVKKKPKRKVVKKKPKRKVVKKKPKRKVVKKKPKRKVVKKKPKRKVVKKKPKRKVKRGGNSSVEDLLEGGGGITRLRKKLRVKRKSSSGRKVKRKSSSGRKVKRKSSSGRKVKRKSSSGRKVKRKVKKGGSDDVEDLLEGGGGITRLRKKLRVKRKSSSGRKVKRKSSSRKVKRKSSSGRKVKRKSSSGKKLKRKSSSGRKVKRKVKKGGSDDVEELLEGGGGITRLRKKLRVKRKSSSGRKVKRKSSSGRKVKRKSSSGRKVKRKSSSGRKVKRKSSSGRKVKRKSSQRGGTSDYMSTLASWEVGVPNQGWAPQGEKALFRAFNKDTQYIEPSKRNYAFVLDKSMVD